MKNGNVVMSFVENLTKHIPEERWPEDLELNSIFAVDSGFDVRDLQPSVEMDKVGSP